MSEVALFDLDHTVYEGLSCIDTMRIQAEAGLIPGETVQRATSILYRYRETNLEFDVAMAAVLRTYAQALAGQSYTRVIRMAQGQFAGTPGKLSEFVRPTVQLLAPDHKTMLVTAQPDFIAAAAAGALGIKKYVSTTFEVTGGTFTGEVAQGLFSGAKRVKAAHNALRPPTYDRTGSFAFVDSESDLALLDTVEHPICVNPTPELQHIAEQREWHVVERGAVTSLVKELLAAH